MLLVLVSIGKQENTQHQPSDVWRLWENWGYDEKLEREEETKNQEKKPERSEENEQHQPTISDQSNEQYTSSVGLSKDVISPWNTHNLYFSKVASAVSLSSSTSAMLSLLSTRWGVSLVIISVSRSDHGSSRDCCGCCDIILGLCGHLGADYSVLR